MGHRARVGQVLHAVLTLTRLRRSQRELSAQGAASQASKPIAVGANLSNHEDDRTKKEAPDSTRTGTSNNGGPAA